MFLYDRRALCDLHFALVEILDIEVILTEVMSSFTCVRIGHMERGGGKNFVYKLKSILMPSADRTAVLSGNLPNPTLLVSSVEY